jgi:hypothetical protein
MNRIPPAAPWITTSPGFGEAEHDPSAGTHQDRAWSGLQVRRLRQFHDKNFASILHRAEITVKTFRFRGRILEMAMGSAFKEGRQ